MKKYLRLFLAVWFLCGNVYAADLCKDKVAEAKKMAAKCKDMPKGSGSKARCVDAYKVAKNQAEQACRSNGLDEKGMMDAITQWEKQVNNCKGKLNSLCANALQQLGHYQFQLEEKQFLDKTARFEELVAWCAERDNKPAKCDINELPKANHQKSLGCFLEYIDKYPKESKTPVVMYQAAAVLEASGEDDKAFKLRNRLVKTFPDNVLVPKAWLRIAEYYFMNRKFRDAINTYKKVTDFDNLTGKEGALAMFHLAESYFEMGEFESAAVHYFNYIVGADKGKYPADLRTESMDFMVAAYSHLEGGGLNEAKSFLKDKNVSFKDSVYKSILRQAELKKMEQASESQAGNKDVAPLSVENDDPTVLRDSRDGRTYRIVEVGGQIWMAENLNYKTVDSYCYNYDDNCTKYGRLYTWSASKEACPEGWHLPSKTEMQELLSETSKNLKSNEWGGEDLFGMSVLPAGQRYKDGAFGYQGREADLWTSTASVGDYAFYLFVDGNNTYMKNGDKEIAMSVRCKKNTEGTDGGVRNSETSGAHSSGVSGENGIAVGSMRDSRDGQIYRTVKIGNREWMADNLRYKTPNSVCLNNNEKYCPLGRYYSLEEPQDWCPEGWHLPALPEIACVMRKNGDCVEMFDGQEALAITVSKLRDDEKVGTMLKAKGTAWNKAADVPEGTDRVGFGAIASGLSDGKEFKDQGGGAYFWTATYDKGNIMLANPDFHMLTGEADNNQAYYWCLYNDSEAMKVNTLSKSLYLSIRCVRDPD